MCVFFPCPLCISACSRIPYIPLLFFLFVVPLPTLFDACCVRLHMTFSHAHPLSFSGSECLLLALSWCVLGDLLSFKQFFLYLLVAPWHFCTWCVRSHCTLFLHLLVIIARGSIAGMLLACVSMHVCHTQLLSSTDICWKSETMFKKVSNRKYSAFLFCLSLHKPWRACSRIRCSSAKPEILCSLYSLVC